MAKKKGLLATAATAIAAVGAIGLAGVSSPVGQEVVNAVQNTQVVQKAPQGKKARANQQQTQQQQQRVVCHRRQRICLGDQVTAFMESSR